MGMGAMVYPGARHTRFQHAIGAFHLMSEAIEVLRSKDVSISEEEKTAVCLAILLHDIGHGPFSHALEHTLLPISHEELSLLYMKKLNVSFDGKLTLAIEIFENKYNRKFFHQLVSGQLDMDRLDYLSRDSYFTGVSEGVIGYNRIIKMLNVKDNVLVVEEKGVYSVEKFLVARRLMYWQVYLHKTALAAEQMLISFLKRVKEIKKNEKNLIDSNLYYFLSIEKESLTKKALEDTLLSNFSLLDDVDVIFLIKKFSNSKDKIAQLLAKGLLNRELFKIEWTNYIDISDKIEKVRRIIKSKYPLIPDAHKYLLINGEECKVEYSTDEAEIKVLTKQGEVVPYSKWENKNESQKITKKLYICYTRSIFN